MITLKNDLPIFADIVEMCESMAVSLMKIGMFVVIAGISWVMV